MTERQQSLLRGIEGAFAGVELGAGVSLHETVVLDNYGSAEERAAAREPDEKHDWRKLITDPDFAAIGAIGGISFYDAPGLRFHLPAYLSLAVIDYNREDAGVALMFLVFALTRLSEYNTERFSILNTSQRKCVRAVLEFVRDEHEPGNAELQKAIDEYWRWELPDQEPELTTVPRRRGAAEIHELSFRSVPGLFLYPAYFTPAECAGIVSASLRVYERLTAAVAGTGGLRKADIPQPEFVRSSRHNLASEEFYTPLVLDEPGQQPIRCEFFPRYGEDGHSLAYFRGNTNLPGFVRGDLIDSVRRTVEDAGVAPPGGSLTWKLTMNFYRTVAGVVAGFPFHVDIPANGVVTMILNIQREAVFQIGNPENDTVSDISLPVGSLLILSGESRSRWMHRVLPMPGGPEAPADGIERISLVLGFQ